MKDILLIFYRLGRSPFWCSQIIVRTRWNLPTLHPGPRLKSFTKRFPYALSYPNIQTNLQLAFKSIPTHSIFPKLVYILDRLVLIQQVSHFPMFPGFDRSANCLRNRMVEKIFPLLQLYYIIDQACWQYFSGHCFSSSAPPLGVVKLLFGAGWDFPSLYLGPRLKSFTKRFLNALSYPTILTNLQFDF